MKIEIPGIKDIEPAAEKFIQSMKKRRVFAFYGEMGAGKTTFIKAVCIKLGVKDNVSSPSFALINEYTSPKAGTIYHIDLYRIKKPEELFDFGYEDYLYSGDICFIEWPGNAENLLPVDAVKLEMSVQRDGSRLIRSRD